MSRASGKTFRLLLSTLVKASNGKDIVYLVQNVHMSRYVLHKALDIVHHYGIDIDCRVRDKPTTIKITNGGSIVFESYTTARQEHYRCGKWEIVHDLN